MSKRRTEDGTPSIFVATGTGTDGVEKIVGEPSEKIDLKIPTSDEQEIKAQKMLDSFLEDSLAAMPNARNFQKAIYNLLNFNLEFDIGFLSAVRKVEKKAEDGVPIIFEDTKWLEDVRQKFSRTIFMNLLVEASGLLHYKDEIMACVIEDVFVRHKTPDSATKRVVSEKKLTDIFSDLAKLIKAKTSNIEPKKAQFTKE